jgi:hypothetical protein
LSDQVPIPNYGFDTIYQAELLSRRLITSRAASRHRPELYAACAGCKAFFVSR